MVRSNLCERHRCDWATEGNSSGAKTPQNHGFDPVGRGYDRDQLVCVYFFSGGWAGHGIFAGLLYIPAGDGAFGIGGVS